VAAIVVVVVVVVATVVVARAKVAIVVVVDDETGSRTVTASTCSVPAGAVRAASSVCGVARAGARTAGASACRTGGGCAPGVVGSRVDGTATVVCGLTGPGRSPSCG